MATIAVLGGVVVLGSLLGQLVSGQAAVGRSGAGAREQGTTGGDDALLASRRQDPSLPVDPTAAGTSLVVTAVSPWVEPDGELRVDLRTTGPVPPDAAITTTVHQRLRASRDESLRAAVAEAIRGGELPAPMRQPTTIPVAQLGDPAVGVVAAVPVRSTRSGGADRLLLTNAGVYPVTVALGDGTGTELASTTVFLNRLPTEMPVTPGDQPGRLSLSLQTVVDGPPALDVSGDATLDENTRSSIAAAAALASASAGAPLTVAIRPNLLDGLSRSDDPADVEALALLRRTIVDPSLDVAMARMTYVPVDTGGLSQTDDGLGELLRQVALGDATLSSTLSTQTDGSTWIDDDTTTMSSLELLQALGVSRLVTDADSLQLRDPDLDPELLTTRAVGLPPSTLTTTAPDADLAALVGAPAGTGTLGTSDGPGRRANVAVTSLMAEWFRADDEGSGAFPGPSAVLSLPPHTDPAVLEALAAALAVPGPITLEREAVPVTPASQDGEALTARLPERSPSDQSGAIRDVVANRRLVDGYRSMASSAVEQTDLWDRVNAQVLDHSLDGAQRRAFGDGIEAEIDANLARVHLPVERRVVLTSRDATIPLRFRNDLPYPVVIELWFRSVRIGIDDDERQRLTLPPGETLLDLDVTARAAGGSLLRVDASSPDGALVLPAIAIPVTSTTISGVGAALSALSLAFLALWWGVTIRRERRRRRDSDDGGPDGDTADATHRSGDTSETADSEPAEVGPPGHDGAGSVNGGG